MHSPRTRRVLGEVIEDPPGVCVDDVGPRAARPRRVVDSRAHRLREHGQHCETAGVNLVVEMTAPNRRPTWSCSVSGSALRRAITSLIDNALAHEHPGGRSPSPSGATMTTSSSTCATTVWGSTQSQWARCFDRFAHGHAHTASGTAPRHGIVWHWCERLRARTAGTSASLKHRAAEPLSRSPFPPHPSGQCHEELFQLGFGHRVLAIGPCAGDAFSKPRATILTSGSVQGARHRGELGDHVLAVAALLDHRDHAVQLSLGRVAVDSTLRRCLSSSPTMGVLSSPWQLQQLPPGVYARP